MPRATTKTRPVASTAAPASLATSDPGTLATLVGAEAVAHLIEAARSAPTVLVIEGLPFLVDIAFPSVVTTLLPTEVARQTDARVAIPEGESWTMDEVDALLVAPTAFIPHVRNVILVTDADRMSAACADHLLKAVEEPMSPTTYCLGVSDATVLPATLRGRVGQAVTLTVDDDALAAWLFDQGLELDLAVRAVTHFATQAALLAQLSDDPTQVSALVDLATHWPDPAKPATAARAANTLLAAAASRATADPLALAGAAPGTAAKSAVAVRRRTRRLAAAVLDSWRGVALRPLEDPTSADAAAQALASARLEALALASQVLSRNGSVELALAVAAGPVPS